MTGYVRCRDCGLLEDRHPGLNHPFRVGDSPTVSPTCAIQPRCPLPLGHKGPHEWGGAARPGDRDYPLGEVETARMALRASDTDHG